MNQTKTGLNLVCWVRWYTIALSHAWDGARAAEFCLRAGSAKLLEARAHVWAPSSANWGISSTTSLAACSQLENHFLVDTHKNFSCFLLCQGKQAENLTKSLVVIPEKKCRFTKCIIVKYQWIFRLFSDKIIWNNIVKTWVYYFQASETKLCQI